MPCGTCGQRAAMQAAARQQLNPRQRWQEVVPAFDADCPYNGEVLEMWYDKLLCIKDQGLLEQLGLTMVDLHRYLGIVISSLNYTSDRCRYRAELEKIEPTIFKLVELNLC